MANFSVIFKFLLFLCCSTVFINGEGKRKFPTGFIFGTSSAAYQIEGAWNTSGKGESIWDHLTHTRPELINGMSNGDIACDSYNNYKRDVEILKDLGVHVYRFSLSWSRLCPTGICIKILKEGLEYYNNLINELIKNGIQPAVTLYHWDLPQRLQDLGGWTNPIVIQYFEWYANLSFNAFGDRVKLWVTFNGPKDICSHGYGGDGNAPALGFSGVADYLCVDTLLKSHAKVYRLYQRDFKNTQKGRIGIIFSEHWYHPADDSAENVKAAEIMREFEGGMFMNPIFGKYGDYPEIVREMIDKRSLEQGLPISRLPILNNDWIEMIKGSSDFFGFNHYTTKLCMRSSDDAQFSIPSYEDDHRVSVFQNQSWPGSSAVWLKKVPWGFRNILNWIKDTYNNPEVIIFENGFADYGELNDTRRVEYHRDYLNALLDAVDEGCNVTGYMVWSFVNNFEWRSGYLEHFGLYHVDFNDPKRTRTPKLSAEFYKSIIKNHTI